MINRKAAPMFLLLAALLGAAQAQLPPMQPLPGMMPMQPLQPMKMPEGAQVATATAVQTGPGASSSFASNINGQTTRYTSTTGPGSFAAAGTSGPDTRGCQVISQSQSGGCNGKPNCCSIVQKVERCPSYSTGVASINGKWATCCITLQRIADKQPQLFCAAYDNGRDYLRMPPNADIELKPSCQSQLSGGGSLACTVTFNRGLPQGFTYPAGFTSKNPLTLYANKPYAGFTPCLNGNFKRHIQATSRTNPVAITAKCE